MRQSINVSRFGGFNEAGTVDISPIIASREAGGQVYSCGGSVEVEWGFTGLLDLVDVKVGEGLNMSTMLVGKIEERWVFISIFQRSLRFRRERYIL